MPLNTPGISTAGRMLALALSLALAACASDDRPKPAPLEPIVAHIGVRPAWTATMGAIDYSLSIRVVGGTAYLADAAGNVVAINTQTGADVWRTALATPLSAGVGSDGRYTAVVTRTNDLVTLDGGKEIWRQHLSALTLTAPLVAGGRVFSASADRTVAAFDAATGRKLWQQARSGDPLVLGQAGLMLAVQDTLLVGLGARVVGMNPMTGGSRWETLAANSRGTNEVERLVDVVAGYSRQGDQLCVRAFQYAVTCLDGVTGKALWSKAANGATGVAGDAADVFGTESDGRVVAFARVDGNKLWESERLRHRVLTAPVLAGNTLVFGDDSGNLHFASRLDGSQLNRVFTDSSGLAVAPVLADKTLIVVSRRGGIFAYRPE
jgi:outer membrane assembly lipoprotein YfgL